MIKNLSQKTFLYPTDTTFGLGCDAFNQELVDKIYHIKERPIQKNFILLVENQTQLLNLVEVPEITWQIIEIANKPITIIYDSAKEIPSYLLAEDQSVAIRLTQNTLCKKIIQNIKNPIISTSANISSQKNPSSYTDISNTIKEEVDYIFPECKDFIPKFTQSSIIKISKNNSVKVIRE